METMEKEVTAEDAANRRNPAEAEAKPKKKKEEEEIVEEKTYTIPLWQSADYATTQTFTQSHAHDSRIHR